jgi:hypothetical protein
MIETKMERLLRDKAKLVGMDYPQDADGRRQLARMHVTAKRGLVVVEIQPEAAKGEA